MSNPELQDELRGFLIGQDPLLFATQMQNPSEPGDHTTIVVICYVMCISVRGVSFNPAVLPIIITPPCGRDSTSEVTILFTGETAEGGIGHYVGLESVLPADPVEYEIFRTKDRGTQKVIRKPRAKVSI